MRVTKHSFSFPFYIPRIIRLIQNWPVYLFNYALRKLKPATYIFRNGNRLIDHSGTLAGTIAVVFVRQEYGTFKGIHTIIDVGANMGCFAVYAASLCPNSVIYCYEPEGRNATCLRNNIVTNSLQGRIFVHQVAVAAQSGLRAMSISSSPMHSLVARNEKSATSSVQCTTLAEIMRDHSLTRVDLLKLNCEGAEYEILEGCNQADYERIQRIRLEYHLMNGSEKNGEILARFLESRGYRIQRFTRYLKESGFIWACRDEIEQP